MIAELISPNWHVVLLHFPLALLVAGLALEIFGGRGGTVRIGARWMLLLGAILSIPTSLSGMFALRETVTGHPVDLHRHWYEITDASPWTADQWTFMSRHVWLNAVGTGVAVLIVVLWLAASDRGRAALRIPGLVALVLSTGMMVVGAWHSGEAVYRMGTAVEARGTWVAPELEVSLVQTHVVGAGIAVMVLVLALGLTLHWPRAVLAAEPGSGTPKSVLRPWWAVGALLLLGVASGGFFLVTGGFEGDALERWWAEVRGSSRLLAHSAAAGTLLVLAVVFMAAPRLLVRRTGIAVALSLLLVATLAAQLWFGTLLLFDTHDGPLTHFVAPGQVEHRASEPGVPVEASAAPAEGAVADASAATAPAAVVEMTSERRYEPASTTVPVGSVVEWRNTSEVVHTVTADPERADDASHVELPEGAAAFHSGEIRPGASWRHRFSVPGRYRYFCEPHESRGMVGTLIVERGSGNGGDH